MKATAQHRKSREARLGSVHFADERMHFNVGYTNCEHCNGRLKIVVTPNEAREIAQRFGYSKPKSLKVRLKARLAIKLQKWASDV